MKIFKNPVGRPPKDLKKKRIITVVTVSLLSLIVILLLLIFVFKVDLFNLMGNSTVKSQIIMLGDVTDNNHVDENDYKMLEDYLESMDKESDNTPADPSSDNLGDGDEGDTDPTDPSSDATGNGDLDDGTDTGNGDGEPEGENDPTSDTEGTTGDSEPEGETEPTTEPEQNTEPNTDILKNKEQADINLDGVIDNKDLEILGNYLDSTDRIKYLWVFDANGGTGTMSAIYVLDNVNTKVPECIFEKEDAECIGFARNKAGDYKEVFTATWKELDTSSDEETDIGNDENTGEEFSDEDYLDEEFYEEDYSDEEYYDEEYYDEEYYDEEYYDEEYYDEDDYNYDEELTDEELEEQYPDYYEYQKDKAESESTSKKGFFTKIIEWFKSLFK